MAKPAFGLVELSYRVISRVFTNSSILKFWAHLVRSNLNLKKLLQLVPE